MNRPLSNLFRHIADTPAVVSATLTLEQRINAQVSAIKGQAFTVADRVAALEIKSQNMDAYYFKTLGTALKGHTDAEIAKLAKEQAKTYAKHEASVAAVHARIDQVNAELAKVNARVSAFIRSLRQIGESNQ